MKKSITAIVILELAALLIAACGPDIMSTPTNIPERSLEWWTAWLKQPACHPPCWQKITPGVTGMADAVSLLENQPNIKIIYSSDKGLSWNFGNNKTGGDLWYSSDGIVSMIRLGNSLNDDLTLSKIVSVYGDASYLTLYDCRQGMCSTMLVYPQIGLLVDLFVEDKIADGVASRVVIEANDVVSNVYFMPPGMDNFKNQEEFQGQSLIDWRGYGEYP